MSHSKFDVTTLYEHILLVCCCGCASIKFKLPELCRSLICVRKNRKCYQKQILRETPFTTGYVLVCNCSCSCISSMTTITVNKWLCLCCLKHIAIYSVISNMVPELANATWITLDGTRYVLGKGFLI